MACVRWIRIDDEIDSCGDVCDDVVAEDAVTVFVEPAMKVDPDSVVFSVYTTDGC